MRAEIIHGATNGMWCHMPAFSHAVGQILQRRRRRPDAMPNEPDQAAAISRATQCRRGGFYQTRFNFHSGGGMRYFTQCRRGGFYQTRQTRCRIHVHERCPAERASGCVSPQTTEPTRVTCATLRRVSRAR